nr:GyrI-like domain-containing protein [Wenxinia saemankumensis]
MCYQSGPLRYLAAMEHPGEGAPADLEPVVIPAGDYAVWTFDGHVSGIRPFVMAIWHHGIREAGFTPRPAPEFERYGADHDAETGTGRVGIWIPVA